MGLLTLFRKPVTTLLRLPAGCFTVSRDGEVLASTLPSSFPAELVQAISQQVLATLQEAARAQLPLAELNVHYPSLKITARELRGGAIVFLSPRTPYAPSTPNKFPAL